MRAMLGVRCPECGTGDAPCVIIDNANREWAICPRCGHFGKGAYTQETLRAFYGPQEAGTPTPATINADLLAALEGAVAELDRLTWVVCEQDSESIEAVLELARGAIVRAKGGEG